MALNPSTCSRTSRCVTLSLYYNYRQCQAFSLAISRKIGNLRTTRATVDFAPLVCYLLRRLVKACRQARAVLTKTAKTPEIYKKAQRSGGSNLCRPKISRPWATPSRRLLWRSSRTRSSSLARARCLRRPLAIIIVCRRCSSQARSLSGLMTL